MNINNQDEDENSLVGQLKIESTILKKTFVGGLRNSKTGKEFHHAFTQSEQSYCFQKYKIQLEKSSIHLNTRGVQTQILINKSAQSKREYGIQMEKTDLKISEEDDRFVSVGNYQNSDDYLKFSSTSAIMIQRLWRGAIARIWVKDYRELIEKEKIREAMEYREKIESDRAAEEYEIDRRINPRAPDDFKLILEELEKSNDEELARLKQTYKDDPLGLTTATLEQLVVLTSTRAKIDSKWHIVKKDRSEKKVMDELSQMATPHSWSLSGNLKGDKAVVDTPETIRAAELLLVMTELTENPSSDLERLQTLSLLREALSGSIKSQLLHDIYELVTREEDWLRRGRSDHLTQLRKRLLYLMKNYINCAEYNPAIAVESLFRNHK